MSVEPEELGLDLLATEIELVPLERLRPHPANPNEGDPEAILESAVEVGFYQVVFAQRSTGFILAGHARVAALARAGAPAAPTVWLDVDDEAAMRILVGDNEIPRQRSQAVPRALAAALQQLAATSSGLAGTGHTESTLRALLTALAPPAPPQEFPDAEALAGHTEHRCPSCGYEWSGSPTPATGEPASVGG